MVQNAEEFFRILDQLGLNFEAINLKYSQIVGNNVVYNLWKFCLWVMTPRYTGHQGVTTHWCIGPFWIFQCINFCESPVHRTPGSLDSPVHRTPGSLDSLVHRTLGSHDFLVHRTPRSHFKSPITLWKFSTDQNGPRTSLIVPRGAD